MVAMEFVLLLLRVLSMVMVMEVILSWVVPNAEAFPRNITHALTEPLCRPLRALISPESLGGLDVSPMLVIVGLSGVGHLIRTLMVNGF